jgi:2-epi-5-epi-valiolone synthase
VRHCDGRQNLSVLIRIGEVCFLNDVSADELTRACEGMQRLLETGTTDAVRPIVVGL